MVAELSVMFISVCANTTNITLAVSPINPVVPGVPVNSASRLWNPTARSAGVVRFTSIIPAASDVPVTETRVSLIMTVTCTPTTGAPVLSINSNLAFTSSPLSVLSLSEGWLTPSRVGFTKVNVVKPRLSKD